MLNSYFWASKPHITSQHGTNDAPSASKTHRDNEAGTTSHHEDADLPCANAGSDEESQRLPPFDEVAMHDRDHDFAAALLRQSPSADVHGNQALHDGDFNNELFLEGYEQLSMSQIPPESDSLALFDEEADLKMRNDQVALLGHGSAPSQEGYLRAQSAEEEQQSLMLGEDDLYNGESHDEGNLNKDNVGLPDLTRAPGPDVSSKDMPSPTAGMPLAEPIAAPTQTSHHRATDVTTAECSPTQDATIDDADTRGRSLQLQHMVPPAIPKRSQSLPPNFRAIYKYVANWPPPPQPPRYYDTDNNPDVFPPAAAPLHVHIQAYALRWGTWASSIEDEGRRAQLLEAVTTKMKQAWDTAIIEGYYARPPQAMLDVTGIRQDGDNADSTSKRGRKRGLSPSKQSAGFSSDSPDKYAVTNGELWDRGITMDMINQRVETCDYEEGELRLNEVLGALPDGREEFVVRDWSASSFPMVAGRNLLMYSLYAVQQTRSEIARLKGLLTKFSKSNQRRTTENRIDVLRAREAQFLALATELTLRENQPEQSDDDEVEEIEAPDSASDDPVVDKSTKDTTTKPATTPSDQMLQLSKSVLLATSEEDLAAAFTSQNVDLQTLTTQSKGDAKAMQLLRKIYQDMCVLLNLRMRVKRSANPAEVIKMHHDTRLQRSKLQATRAELRKNLRGRLDKVGSPQLHEPIVPSPVFNKEAPVQHPGNGVRQRPEEVIQNDKSSEVILAPSPGQSSGHHNLFKGSGSTGSSFDQTKQNWPNAPPASVEHQSDTSERRLYADSHRNNAGEKALPPSTTDTRSPALSEEIPAAMKQDYIDEQWHPFFVQAFQAHGLPLPQVKIRDWSQMRDLFEQLGYNPEERNVQLRRFRSGFQGYAAQRQAQMRSISNPASLSSTAYAIRSPKPTSTEMPSNWPTDEEILAAVPAQGADARKIIKMFEHRVGSFTPQFGHQLKRLGRFEGYVWYPLKAANTPTKQYDTRPPPIKKSVDTSVTLPTSTSEPPKSGVVKLKVGRPSLDLQIQHDHPDEDNMLPQWRSNTVEGAKGFFFRHLPNATIEQRQKMDDDIYDYINKTARTKRKRYGQYEKFPDPNDPSGPYIMHGFWDWKDSARPEWADWFFNGEDIPHNWDIERGEFFDDQEATRHDHQYPEDAQPRTPRAPTRLKIKIGRQGLATIPKQSRSQTPFFTSGYMNNPSEYDMHCQPSDGTINPAQLHIHNHGSSEHDSFFSSDDTQPRESKVRRVRGKKRAAMDEATPSRQKKPKVHFDDADDSGDYDPNNDY